MDEGSCVDLSKYRLERANEEIKASKGLLELGYFNASASRSYYAIFYALLSVTVLDGFESSKHSGIISHFIHNYVKTKIFDKTVSDIIKSAFEIRTDADYEAFYTVSSQNAMKQINDAEKIIAILRPYLEKRWTEIEKGEIE